ncbi:MAG: TRAP transporter fused permease subunit [Aquisalimonadaceae bacterium]
MKPSPLLLASWSAGAIGFALAVYAVVVAYVGIFDIAYTRALVVYTSIIAVLLSHPLAAAIAEDRKLLRCAAWGADLAAIAAITIAIWFFLKSADNLATMLVSYGTLDIVVALFGILTLLEATRRLFGLPIVLFIAVVFAYGLFGAYLPDFLSHSGFSLSDSMEMVWYGYQGVYGTPLSIVIQVVLVFIVFGVMLEGTGASNSLIRIAFAITGRSRGGVGHAAIVSSGLFGSMSGSVVANVVGTGAFTIPMMIRRGFKPYSAAAVEAAASTGGQIMPPVMGAAAFLMADLIGMPYLMICLAALLPALFYYGALFISVSLEAGRAGIQPIPKHERETIDRKTLLQSLMFVTPILTIIAVLVMGRSPAMAGFSAIITVITAGLLLNPELRRNPGLIARAAVRGGLAGASIIVVVAAVGIILGTLNLTGAGLTFASTVAALGENNLILALILTALTCLILGMGMPTLPAYLIIVLILGRSLRELGIEPLAIHLFVLYFGVLSAITPPVAVAVFAAAPIAGAHPLTTAIAALRLAFIGFVIPFVFVVEPSLLLVLDSFSINRFLLAATGLSVSILALSTAFYAYDGMHLGPTRCLVRVLIGIAPIAALLAGSFQTIAVLGSALFLTLDFIVHRKLRRMASYETPVPQTAHNAQTSPEGPRRKK